MKLLYKIHGFLVEGMMWSAADTSFFKRIVLKFVRWLIDVFEMYKLRHDMKRLEKLAEQQEKTVIQLEKLLDMCNKRESNS